jgi:hypothetical protein
MGRMSIELELYRSVVAISIPCFTNDWLSNHLAIRGGTSFLRQVLGGEVSRLLLSCIHDGSSLYYALVSFGHSFGHLGFSIVEPLSTVVAAPLFTFCIVCSALHVLLWRVVQPERFRRACPGPLLFFFNIMM